MGSLARVIAVAGIICCLPQGAFAGKIGLNASYTPAQLKDGCQKNGGTYEEGPSGYSCRKPCAGAQSCVVTCKRPSSCVGECPKCVARIRGGFGRNAGIRTILRSSK